MSNTCPFFRRFFVRCQALSGIATIAIALLHAAARADVIEIDAEGTPRFRTGGGAVAWIISPSLQDPSPDGASLPPAAVTEIGPPPSPPAFTPSLIRAAAFAGVSPALLEAVIWQESRWRPGAVSPKGALGLGQLMPATARSLGVDPRDPDANLLGAARYLRAQLDRFDNNLELALAAYNAGPGRVAWAKAIPDIAETRAYVAGITARLAQFTRFP